MGAVIVKLVLPCLILKAMATLDLRYEALRNSPRVLGVLGVLGVWACWTCGGGDAGLLVSLRLLAFAAHLKLRTKHTTTSDA